MMKRSSRLRKRLKKKIVVPIASAFLTVLERARSTALSLLNRLDDEASEIAEVFGCRNCRLIYDPSLYHPSNLVRRYYNHWHFCPACGDPGTRLLGPVPSIVTTPTGTSLVEENGATLGPYKTETEAIHHLWEWFDQEPNHGNCKEKGRKENKQETKVIRLIKKGGILTKEGEGT